MHYDLFNYENLYLNRTASQKVKTGTVFVVAAAKEGEVYFIAIPAQSKLVVILQVTHYG